MQKYPLQAGERVSMKRYPYETFIVTTWLDYEDSVFVRDADGNVIYDTPDAFTRCPLPGDIVKSNQFDECGRVISWEEFRRIYTQYADDKIEEEFRKEHVAISFIANGVLALPIEYITHCFILEHNPFTEEPPEPQLPFDFLMLD